MKNPCISQTIDKLYKDRSKTGDVKFIVGSEEIWAHRCVLAALSPKYETQFYGSVPDTGDIKVEDVSAAVFREFLQFFYSKNVALTIENIEDVLILVIQSLAERLENECTKCLIDTVTLDKMSTYLRLALLHNLNGLQEKCNDVINVKSKMLFETEDFLSFDKELLLYVVSLDTLNCKETDVFEACMKWARAECKRQQIDDTNAENLRAALGDVFFNIRFGSMKIEEFVHILNLHPNLFTMAESNEVFVTIAKVHVYTNSNFFNKTPRQLRAGPIVSFGRSLSCALFRSVGISEITFHQSNTYFHFLCNKTTINLNGFIMVAQSTDDFSVMVNRNNYDHRKILIQKSNGKLAVIFQQSIRVLSDNLWSIAIKFQNEPSTMLGGYLISQNQVNGVSFDFCRNMNKFNIISQLLFNPVD